MMLIIHVEFDVQCRGANSTETIVESKVATDGRIPCGSLWIFYRVTWWQGKECIPKLSSTGDHWKKTCSRLIKLLLHQITSRPLTHHLWRLAPPWQIEPVIQTTPQRMTKKISKLPIRAGSVMMTIMTKIIAPQHLMRIPSGTERCKSYFLSASLPPITTKQLMLKLPQIWTPKETTEAAIRDLVKQIDRAT